MTDDLLVMRAAASVKQSQAIYSELWCSLPTRARIGMHGAKSIRSDDASTGTEHMKHSSDVGG